MAEAITTNKYRELTAATWANELTASGEMAFGDGGHNPDGSVIPPQPSQTGLNNEMLRKPLESIFQEDAYSCTVVGRVNQDELVGVSLSESGLFSGSGDLLGLRNFTPKVKETDETYEITFTLKF